MCSPTGTRSPDGCELLLRWQSRGHYQSARQEGRKERRTMCTGGTSGVGGGCLAAAPLSLPDKTATTTWGHSVKSGPSSGRWTQPDTRMGADPGHLSE